MNLNAFADEVASHGLIIVGGKFHEDDNAPETLRFVSREEQAEIDSHFPAVAICDGCSLCMPTEYDFGDDDFDPFDD